MPDFYPPAHLPAVWQAGKTPCMHGDECAEFSASDEMSSLAAVPDGPRRSPKGGGGFQGTAGMSAGLHYQISGLCLKSGVQLAGFEALRKSPSQNTWHILERRTKFPFSLSWPYKKSRLKKRPDGSWLLAWPKRGVFWMRPRKRRVDYVAHPRASRDHVLDILLGPVLSYLLIFEGRQPLHGSSVKIKGKAVCFLGEPGTGKSSTAAAFLLSGYPVIVDDLLVVQKRGKASEVCPGSSEIRLWPASGKKLLPEFYRLPLVLRTASKRRLDSRKIRNGFVRKPVPLGVIYELRRRRIQKPYSEEIPKKEAVRILIKNLYNTAPAVNQEVLKNQFLALSRLAQETPIRRLALPLKITKPFLVARFVLKDLARLM